MCRDPREKGHPENRSDKFFEVMDLTNQFYALHNALRLIATNPGHPLGSHRRRLASDRRPCREEQKRRCSLVLQCLQPLRRAQHSTFLFLGAALQAEVLRPHARRNMLCAPGHRSTSRRRRQRPVPVRRSALELFWWKSS